MASRFSLCQDPCINLREVLIVCFMKMIIYSHSICFTVFVNSKSKGDRPVPLIHFITKMLLSQTMFNKLYNFECKMWQLPPTLLIISKWSHFKKCENDQGQITDCSPFTSQAPEACWPHTVNPTLLETEYHKTPYSI